MRPLVLVDVDDVILHWTEAFRSFLEKKGVITTSKYPTQWDLTHWVGQPALPFIEEFNHSEDFEHLEADEAAIFYLNRLFNQGFLIHAITSCTDDPKAVQRRMDNLERHFGNIFEGVTCLPLRGCKEDALRKHQRGSFWVEDKLENAILGAKVGHRAMLIDRPHNRMEDHPEVTRCESWGTIYGLIITETVHAINATSYGKREHASQE